MAQPAGDMKGFEELVRGQLATIAARLDDLARRMESESRAPQRPEDVPGQAELRAALHNLVEHLELAEGRTTEAIGHLRERLEEVAMRTQEALRLAGSDEGRDSAGIHALQERIDALNERLEDIRAATESSTRAYVDTCIGELAGKVEKVQALSARLPDHVGEIVGERAAEAAENRVREAEERMAAMVARLQNKLEDLAAGAMDVDRLRTDLEQVDGQLKAVREELAEKAGAEDVRQVREALRQLSAQVETKADRDEVRGLRERLDALAAQLETAHAAGTPAEDARLSRLEEQVLSIRDLVEEALGAPLAALDEKLGAHEKRLEEITRDMGRVRQLEEVIAQLQQALESGGVAQEGESGPVRDVAALKTGLAEVENFARESDRKTRDMLKAVHETLAEVVERLIALEEGREAPAAPAEADAAAPTAAAPQEKAAAEGAETEEAGAEGGARGAGDAQGSPVEDLLAEAAPQPKKSEESKSEGGFDANEIAKVIAGLTPQTRETRAVSGTSAREEPAIISAKQSQQAEQSRPEPRVMRETEQDFIAAARRAALAANDGGGGEKKKSGGLLGRLLGKSSDGDEPAQPTATATPATATDMAPATTSVESAGDREGDARSLFAGLRQRFAARKAAHAARPDDAGADAGGEAEDGKSGFRTRLLLAGLVLLSAAAVIVNRSGPFNGATSSTPAAVHERKGDGAPARTGEAPGREQAPLPRAENGKKGEKAGDESRHSALSSSTSGKRVAFDDTGMTAVPQMSPRAATMLHTGSISALGPAATAPKAGNAAATRNASLPEGLGTLALRRAALSGDGKAAFLVGVHYLKGQGVPRDPKAAREWFERAAAKGVVVAMYRLGAMYEQGQGVPRDSDQAKVWYERAAGRGNVRAMHNLGVLLASGRAGAPEYEKAAWWFRKAAEHGVRDSQFNLAVLHHRGQGVRRDLAEAWFWYAVAARGGDAAAAEQERKLKPYVNKRRLAAMQKRLKTFRPKSPIRNANVVVIDRPEWRGEKERVKSAANGPRARLKPLTGRKLVAEVQRLLKKMGYDVGAVDGVMGNRTANAIRLFQLQSRMPVNGQPSMSVLKRLLDATQGI